MPIYIVKPYEVKEEEFEAIAEDLFTQDEKEDDKNRNLAINHEVKLRKSFIDCNPPRK